MLFHILQKNNQGCFSVKCWEFSTRSSFYFWEASVRKTPRNCFHSVCDETFNQVLLNFASRAFFKGRRVKQSAAPVCLNSCKIAGKPIHFSIELSLEQIYQQYNIKYKQVALVWNILLQMYFNNTCLSLTWKTFLLIKQKYRTIGISSSYLIIILMHHMQDNI